MGISIIIAVVISVLVAVIALVLFLLYKYQKRRREKRKKDKLYSEIYVKLFNQEEKEKRRQKASKLEHDSNPATLCQGEILSQTRASMRYNIQCFVRKQYHAIEGEVVAKLIVHFSRLCENICL